MTIQLKEATEQYLGFLKKQGKSERTLYTYGVDLACLKRFFGEEQALADINTIKVGKFLKSPLLLKNAKNGSERSDITINKNIRVMRQFFAWAVKKGLIDEMPLPKSVPLGRLKANVPQVV